MWVPTGSGLSVLSATDVRSDTSGSRRPSADLVRVAGLVSVAALGLQAVALLVISTVQYSRFGLGVDFTTSNQAAFLIAHGHLDPYVSTHRYPYLDDHFGLLLYPIALLYLVYPHGVVLLWLQDLAGVGAEVTAVWWVVEIVRRRMGSSATYTGIEGGGAARFVAPGIVLGVLVLLLSDPWFYTACLFDFHLNAFSALFLLLAARDAWNGRLGRAAIFAVLLLLTGDTGGLYLAGLGISVLLGAAGRRRYGAIAVVVGAVWVVAVHDLGVDHSHVLVGSYTYLVTGSPLVAGSVTLVTVAKALIEHPQRWIQMIWGRKRILYQVLVPTGVIGIVSPWAVGADVMVYYLQAIAYPLTFLVNGFDMIAGILVVLVGSAMVMAAMAMSGRRFVRVIAAVLGLGMLVQSVVLGVVKIPETYNYFFQVSPSQAAVLSKGLAATPPSAEVIASWGVMGRFSDRQWDYPLYQGVEAAPVRARTVVFVLTTAGLEDDPPATVAAITEYVRTELRATTIAESHGVGIFEWHPPRGTTQVGIPSP